MNMIPTPESGGSEDLSVDVEEQREKVKKIIDKILSLPGMKENVGRFFDKGEEITPGLFVDPQDNSVHVMLISGEFGMAAEDSKAFALGRYNEDKVSFHPVQKVNETSGGGVDMVIDWGGKAGARKYSSENSILEDPTLKGKTTVIFPEEGERVLDTVARISGSNEQIQSENFEIITSGLKQVFRVE